MGLVTLESLQGKDLNQIPTKDLCEAVGIKFSEPKKDHPVIAELKKRARTETDRHRISEAARRIAV
jgi:tryptophan synthase alpha subunit